MTKEDEPKGNGGGEGKHSGDSPQSPGEEIRSDKEITTPEGIRGVVVRRGDDVYFEPHTADLLPTTNIPLDEKGNVKGLPGRPFVDPSEIPPKPAGEGQKPSSGEPGERSKRTFGPLSDKPRGPKAGNWPPAKGTGNQPPPADQPKKPDGDKPKGGK